MIAGYTVQLGSSARSAFQAHVSIKVEPGAQSDVEYELAAVPAIFELYGVCGEFDFIAVVYASVANELELYLDKIRKIRGIKETVSSIILSRKVCNALASVSRHNE
jgi:hypothetical protein